MSSHSAIEKFVARLLRRSPLNAEEQELLLRLPYRTAQFGPRMDIVSPGERTTEACLVAKGLVGRYDQLRDGKRQITSLYIPGDMCDLHSTVAPIAAWGLAALAPTTILFVPHVELGSLAAVHPQIALAFWRDGTVDSSVLAKWLVNLGRQDARGRFAHLLCEIGIRMEVAGLGTRTSFMMDATQEQLADALGLTAVHVNRTLQGLRKEGLVCTRSHMIEVLDWPALAAAGDFVSDYLLLNEPRKREFGPSRAGDIQIHAPLS